MAPRVHPSTTLVPGFRFSGLSARIKANGRPDLALVVADEEVAAGGVFTTNLVRAAPVLVAADRVARGKARAVLVNSGCANACTGEPGLEAATSTSAAVAHALAAAPESVLPASTGVIGVTLPASKVIDQIPQLIASLREDGADRFAEAILTTDRGPKVAHASGEIDGKPFVVLGIAKGAGMFHPAMAPLVPHATMLAFLFTDAVAEGPVLTRILHRVADATFNQSSVDGDTSTNDTLIALASGRARTSPASVEAPGALEEAFMGVAEHLTREMVADGEGAEHLIEVVVRGLPSDAAARLVARTIATSPLVKTAFFGKDPNWGRLLAAAGRAGVPFDPARASMIVGGVPIVEGGQALGAEREAAAHEVMTRPSYSVELVLGDGPGRGRYLTCDLGLGYVRCNADYRS
jgi:glutamate N-acetyltransferase/amino-acid N-acetyltransferase